MADWEFALQECLSEDVILDLIEGRVTLAEPPISLHLDRCSSCRQLLTTLIPDASGTHEATNQVLTPGRRLGRYRVLEVIGAGATGLVYAAQDSQLGRRVALKLLRPIEGSPTSHEMHLRLLREAQALARLSHPHVVSVHDVGEDGDQVFVAIDLVEGGTLTDWLKAKRRTWREIQGVFLRAGEGLAAAHAAGLVHRDFKPDNVLVGTKGEVRVTDFGLARWDESAPSPETPIDLSTVGIELTRTGTLVGTPAFMAPEQLAGRKADARSDQFSFAVSLYLALYGERPFPGNTAAELLREINADRPRGGPSKAGVPTRIRRILLRSLRANPAHRFPSMEELLAALRRAPPPIARTAAIAVAFVGLTAFAVYQRRQSSSVCAGAQAAWGEVWNDAQRSDARGTFLATQSPSAGDTFQRFDAALLDYRQRWLSMRTEACEATHLRHEQSDALLDLRVACLNDRLRKVEQLVKVFAEVDTTLLERAVSAAKELPGLEECANASALTAIAPLPKDDKSRAEIARLSEDEAKGEALWLAGRYAQGLDVVRPALTRAEALGCRPIWARLLYQEGALLERLSSLSEAERVFWQTTALAEEARDDGVAADAWVWLASLAVTKHRWSEAPAYFRLNEACLFRMGGDDLREVDRLRAESYFAGGQQRWEDEIALSERAFAILRRLGREDDWRAAEVPDAMGEAHEGEGRLEEALADFQRTVAMRERIFGPSARDIGGALLDQAEVERRLGRNREALEHAKRAMAIRRTGRFDSDGESQLAAAYRAAGQLDNALQHDERAISDAEAEGGKDDWRVSLGLLGKGQDLFALGHAVEAVPFLERALGLRAQDQPPDSEVPFALAKALWETAGDRRRARVLAETAVRAREPLAHKYGSFYAEQLAEMQTWLRTHQDDPSR
jgi:eukaryotic-like serine/threonine-protein kinase